MSKWLGIVCVVACFGIGCGDDDVTTDTGPVVTADGGTDSGPVVDDTGPVEDTGAADDAGAPMCDMYDGSYGVVPDPENATFCGMANISSCAMLTTDGVPTVTCTLINEGEDDSEISGECTYDADCVCTGMTTITVSGAEIPLTISGDFPNLTLTATAIGMECNFTLTAM